MSLYCSLLGHRFDEPEVEREREERGEEVVTISREIETCRRCGEQRVVSENTEVRTVDPTPDHVGDDTDDEPGPDEPEPDADSGLGGIVGRSGTGGAESAPDPAEEDAEILTESSSERDPGEWPDEPSEDEDAVGTETTDGSGPDPVNAETTDDDTFYCPACGFTADLEGSALREGDACPECMEGYLETR